MDTIHVPKVDPKNHGSLTGVSLMSIDTDVDSNLVLAVNGLVQIGHRILSVVPFTSHAGREGYLILSQEPKVTTKETVSE